jgi:hypothetical protein
MALQIFSNIDRNTMVSGLVVSATNLTERPTPQLVAGDKVSIDVFLTSKSGIADIQAYSVQRLALGLLNGKPESGDFNLDFTTGGGSDIDLAFDCEASDLQDAISSEGSEANTTTKIAPFVFITDFSTTGQKTLPIIGSSGLSPASTVSIQRLIEGTSTVKERWITKIFRDPIALVDTWTNIEPTTGQKGIRGSLNLGTQGIYDLLDSSTSASTTMELELTDSSGNLQTIFQSPTTIFSQVIGEAIAGVIPTPSGIPASATTFLNSFPDPSFAGQVNFNSPAIFDSLTTFNDDAEFESAANFKGSSQFEDDVEISGGGLELSDGNLELTASNNLTLTSGGKIEIGDLHISEGEIVINNDSELIRLATDERTLIGQGDETVLDWSSHDQTSFPASDAKIGIRESNPSSALDVNGTIKANSINVNSQKFYVDPNDDYIKAGGYGTGDFSTLTGSENQPKTTPAFGSDGKVVEKTFIKTIKLQGTGFTGLGTPVQIVAAPGAGKYNVPLEMTVFNDYGTRSGEWGSASAQASIQIGTFQNSDNTGNFAPFLTLPLSTAENTGDWLAHKTFRNIESKQFADRDIVLKALNSNYPSSEANAPDGEWYIRVEYMILGESAGFENNVDQTIGTPFS